MPIPVLHPEQTFGELNVQPQSPVEVLAPRHPRPGAGVWAVVAQTAEISQVTNSGPAATAAVVAQPSTSDPALYAICANGSSVVALGHAGNPTIDANNDGQNGVAINGVSNSGNGVRGTSTSAQGVVGLSTSQVGVLGESQQFDGLWGITHNPTAAGVSGHNPNGLAGFFEGKVEITGDLIVHGDICLPTGGDVAESFATEGGDIEPGTVVVIAGEDSLRASAVPYDSQVAGVVSGAGALKPGIILTEAKQAGRCRLALSGRAYCKVDASYAPIRVGDLLTTSENPGHAMKATDVVRATGAVIGKALRALDSGTSLIPILVALQ